MENSRIYMDICRIIDYVIAIHIKMDGDTMNPDHDYFRLSLNPSPEDAELSVLFSGEGHPHKLHKMGPAIHDYFIIHTVTAGNGTFMLRGTSYNCQTGDSFIIYPGELFFYQADALNPWRYHWVAFVGSCAKKHLTSIGASPDEPIITGSLNAKVRSYYSQLIECFPPDAPSELSNLEAGGLLQLLLQQFGLAKRRFPVAALHLEAESTSGYIVKQAVQYLSLQYTQKISIAGMSNMLGYHRTYLCKLFKQSTGLSPMQYLLNIRMTRAKQLLLSTEMTIDQVASSVGFDDALYFSKKFRKWQGIPPTEYRKSLQEARSLN